RIALERCGDVVHEHRADAGELGEEVGGDLASVLSALRHVEPRGGLLGVAETALGLTLQLLAQDRDALAHVIGEVPFVEIELAREARITELDEDLDDQEDLVAIGDEALADVMRARMRTI